MRVRLAHPDDHDWIVSVQLAMALESEGMYLDKKTVDAGVSAVLSDKSKGHYWIVEDGKQPICMCLTIPEWSDWRNGTVLWIHSVFTLPESRGKGAYRFLYNHLKQMVLYSPDLRGLRLYVDKRNLQAKTVYEKLGMSSDHYELYEWLQEAESQ